MELDLTFEKLVNFPIDFLTKSEKYYEYVETLSTYSLNNYDVKEIRSKVEKIFIRFKDAKYVYKYPIESEMIKITPSYQLREVMSQRSNVSQDESIVARRCEKEYWIVSFYSILMDIIATKLTKEEAIYLIDTFFKSKSEEYIAEKLAMCKGTLQKHKKSCLVKVWVELKALIEEE